MPDEAEAMERGWRVVGGGFDESPPVSPPRRHPFRRLATAGAAACVLIGAAFTPPGEAFTDWLSDALRPEPETAAPPLRLPADGRLLVNTAAGPWIVQQDGSKRLLGRYEDASWSPGGLFVVASRGRQLAALEPGGRVRWTLDADQPVTGARWAPSGYRIAYLTGQGRRRSLRAVAGDGTGDRLVSSQAAETPPSWRPGLRHVLAYAGPRGEVIAVDVDTGEELWRTRAASPIRQLTWSADGQRLVARGRWSVRLLNAQGQTIRARQLAEPHAPAASHLCPRRRVRASRSQVRADPANAFG